MSPRHYYSAEQLNWLRKNRPHYTETELTDRFNEHFCLNISRLSLKRACLHHRILSGRDGKFGKGHPAWNKPKDAQIKTLTIDAAAKQLGISAKLMKKLAIGIKPVGSDNRGYQLYEFSALKSAANAYKRKKDENTPYACPQHDNRTRNQCLLFRQVDRAIYQTLRARV